jgi:hypothetical protein
MDEGDDDDDEVDEVKGYSDDGDDSDYPVLTIKRTSLSTTPSRRQGGSRQNWETVYMIVRTSSPCHWPERHLQTEFQVVRTC